jgi:hypothetical protein
MEFKVWLEIREELENIKSVVVAAIPEDIKLGKNPSEIMAINTKSLDPHWVRDLLRREIIADHLKNDVQRMEMIERESRIGMSIQQLIDYLI